MKHYSVFGVGLTIVSVFVLVGCFPSYEFKDLTPRNQQTAFGTQPGYHELSPHFAVEVDYELTRFYYLGKPGSETEEIGAIVTRWAEFSNYGPREIAYAISDDGKRLLFYNEPGVGEGEPLRIVDYWPRADLYLFDIDAGSPKLVHRDAHRQVFICGEFPRDYIYLGKIVADRSTPEGYAYSTQKNEKSLDEIRRKLEEVGRSHEFCDVICESLSPGHCAY